MATHPVFFITLFAACSMAVKAWIEEKGAKRAVVVGESLKKTLPLTGLQPAESQVYIHSNNYAGYYPGAKTIDLTLLFDPEVRAPGRAQGLGVQVEA